MTMSLNKIGSRKRKSSGLGDSEREELMHEHVEAKISLGYPSGDVQWEKGEMILSQTDI
jgi:hypothetical protein